MSPLPNDVELRRALALLRDRMRQDVGRLAPLRSVAARRVEIDLLVADLDRQLERLQRAAVITLVGATGAGKSTLLNALAGSAIASEGVDRPTTRQPTVYAPPDADLDELLGEAVAKPAGYDSQGGPVVVRHAATGPWATQVLIDAPDLNSIDSQHRATVTALAERSDVLVVVLHHQSVVEEASVSFVDAFAGRRQMLFVLNRSDELTPAARSQILEQVRLLARRRWRTEEAPVLCLSARDARVQPAAEGWAEFCRTLHDLVHGSSITRVRRLNALGAAARLQALFHEVWQEVETDLALLPDECASGITELEGRVAAEAGARLELRRADLTTLLCAEAAKRWDGPGGWALRVGSASALGLGAGGVLLRRHPLLAAGAAAGSLMVERLRDSLRELRLADPAGLMPSEVELASWHAQALAAARVRAGRLTGETESLALPSAGTVYTAIATAVTDAWNTLVDRDLPAAAERSVLRFLRLLLDLPVYALGGYIIYRVATGFAAGEHTGVDFLVNAALLATAYLIPVRVLVRRGLAGRARRLLRAVITHVREALASQAEATRNAVSDTTAELRAVLGRLRALEDTWRSTLAARR